ncbi:MAG: efflux RND transporter periplasmic adaptor subunit [Phycisphaerales bacterium]|nr:efflux RND transporter periplasmic adaptor subunit [Phycisphaerales bacterium]
MIQRVLVRLVGIVVGLALAGGAIYAVFFVDWRPEPEPPAPMVRPVRTITVGEVDEFVRRYPARVRASSEVTLAFQVPGVIQILPMVRGASVRAGDTLAQLDQRDFTSRLTAARVQYDQLRSELAAVTDAFEAKAATALELARFQASTDRARTEVELAEKALEDTTLVAPFDGVIADLFVDQFQKVGVGVPILRLQGRSSVRIQVNVDPARMAMNSKVGEGSSFAVRFDFLPDHAFDARLVEFTTEADPRTQTFLAIFEIDSIPGVSILAGMPATLVEHRTLGAGGAMRVPVQAIDTDGLGASFAWVVSPEPGGEATVHRQAVRLGSPLDDSVEVLDGLDVGRVIVAAGLGELRDGQRVRPIPRAGEGPATGGSESE